MAERTLKTAHEIAADPDLYNLVWKVGKLELECNGYSKTGNTVRFSDVRVNADRKLELIIRYVHPDKSLEQVAPPKGQRL